MAHADGTIYINTAIETDGMKAGGKEVEAAARRMAKSVSGIGESARLALQKQTDSFVRQNQMYEQQRQKVEALKAKIEEARETRVPTDRFKELEKQFEKDTVKLERLKKTQQDFLATGGKQSSSAYKRRQIQIEELENSLQQARKEQEELLRSGKAYSPVDTSAMEERLIAEQEKLKESGNRLGTSYEQLKQKVLDYGGVIRECGGYLGILQTIFLGAKRAIEVTGMALLRFPIAVIQLIAGFVQRLGSTAKKAVVHLANLVKKSIINGFKKLASAAGRAALSLSGMNKQAKKSKNTFGKSLKTILKYTLGIRSMYILVNKIRTGIKEGFSNLAQYSGETNQSISSLMSALTQLKNSLATAFNPILTVVSPALTKLINLLSKAATYVGMFFAAFTGKKTFVKAVAVQQDYAAGLKDSASAAKEAEKANESYLSGLDEVRKFETGKDDSGKDDSGKDAGTGELSPADMFETVPIENSIADMVQKIKDLIKNEDWEGLGAYMASGINAGLQKIYDAINWDNVGPKITYFVDAFTRTFNSLVDNIDWDLMGRTIGAGINTVVNTLNLLIEGIDWVNLGKSFATGIMGIVKEMDWRNFGNLIGNKFMIGWKIFYGFVTNLDYKAIGLAIADGITGMVEKIDLNMIFSAISTFVIGVFETLTTAIQNINWYEVGQKVADGLASVDWVGIAEGFFRLLGAALGGLAAFLGGLISGAVESAREYFAGKIEEMGGDIGGGILLGIVDGLANIGTWIKEHIFQPFIDGFKSVFGIASPSKVMEEMGTYIMEGLLNGIKSLVDSVTQIWENMKKTASRKWEEIKQNLSDAWENIKSSADEKWTSISEKLSEKMNDIKDDTKDIMSRIKDSWSDSWDNMKDSVSSAMDKVKKTIKSATEWISDKLKSISDKISNVGKKASGLSKSSSRSSGSSRNVSSASRIFAGISYPRIPYLATGAVIPPNAPFLALMGEQKNGTNLEAPESLIRKIVREETGRNQQSGGTNIIKLYLDGKQIAEAVVKQGKIEQMSSGRNMFALG